MVRTRGRSQGKVLVHLFRFSIASLYPRSAVHRHAAFSLFLRLGLKSLSEIPHYVRYVHSQLEGQLFRQIIYINNSILLTVDNKSI